MNILLLSDFETQFGGAAICATRLADGLLDCGHQVTRLVCFRDNQNHRWKTSVVAPSSLTWAALRNLPPSVSEPFAGWDQKWMLARLLKDLKPDVINIHNIHGAMHNGWTTDLLSVCQEYAPVVWTLHDMWSITGRCAFAYECLKYVNGCDSTCPTPHEYPALQPHRIANSWHQRELFFLNCKQITAVCPSTWLANTARQGFWRREHVEVIPYGLPLEIYAPQDRKTAREILGLDVRGRVILVAGFKLDDRRKGLQFVVEAIRRVPERPITFLSFGTGSLQIDLPGVTVHDFGFIDHEQMKALIYSSADLFLHPALADNLPNTVLESIACGTPVVAFPVGGLPELVREGETGWLAKEVGVDALADCLQVALSDINSGSDLTRSCRLIAEQEYPSDLQAQRYLNLFTSLN